MARFVLFVALALVIAAHASAAVQTHRTGSAARVCVSNPVLLNAGRSLDIPRTWGALVLCVSESKNAAYAARMFANAACRWEAKTAGLGISPGGTVAAYGRVENFHAAMNACRVYKATAALRSLPRGEASGSNGCFAPPSASNDWKESWPTFEIFLVRERC